MRRLFLQLSRSGVSWVAADRAGARSAPQASHTRITPDAVCELAAAVAAVDVVISWAIGRKLAAIARVCEKFDAAASHVLATAAVDLTRSHDMASIASIPAGPEPETACDLATQYFTFLGPLLPPGASPSSEQWEIITAFERRLNIVCRAVAGAGKTTTLLMCASRRKNAKCLLLTYNKRLQLDVAARAAESTPGLVALTYHAAAGRAYGTVIANDERFREAVGAAPSRPLAFDSLMLDEAQDMSLEYFAFVRHLLRANPGAQVVVVGDERQAINEFRGARPEFLSEAPRLYAALAADHGWAPLTLSVSHRLTPATAAFVNRHLYGADVIVGGNNRSENRLPIYVSARSKSELCTSLPTVVKDAVRRYGPEGVYVLAPSVRNLSRSQSPLGDLVRRHLAGIPTYVAGNDDARVDAELIRGKLALLSFNSSKGCERPCVICVGIDETYFDFFDRAWNDPTAVPNVITVAATRAISQLVVVTCNYRTIRTASFADLFRDVVIVGKSPPAAPKIKARPPPRQRVVSTTDLIRHLHPETVRAALAMVSIRPADRKLRARLDALPPPSPTINKVRFGNYCEDLGFVYGIIGPVLAELHRTGTTAFGEGMDAPTILEDHEVVRPFSTDITRTEFEAYPPRFWETIADALRVPPAARTVDSWARLAIARNAIEDGHHHIARQVPDYGWVDQAALNSTRDAILHVLEGVAGAFEVRLPSIAVGSVTVVGRADFIAADGELWEFKNGGGCDGGVYREEHALQLACYLALRGGGNGVLFSIPDRAAWHIEMEPGVCADFLKALATKARGTAVDIFACIDRYDRGVANPLGIVGTPMEPDSEPGGAEFDVSDVF